MAHLTLKGWRNEEPSKGGKLLRGQGSTWAEVWRLWGVQKGAGRGPWSLESGRGSQRRAKIEELK